MAPCCGRWGRAPATTCTSRRSRTAPAPRRRFSTPRKGTSSMSLPILPTSVIGSYSMPEWLERAKNDYLSRKLNRRDLDEMHDSVRKAAIKDQEVAGLDIVSDGEAQRDNMIDYFTERMPGVQVDQGSKRFYYDFYESIVRSKLATGTLGLDRKSVV